MVRKPAGERLAGEAALLSRGPGLGWKSRKRHCQSLEGCRAALTVGFSL